MGCVVSTSNVEPIHIQADGPSRVTSVSVVASVSPIQVIHPSAAPASPVAVRPPKPNAISATLLLVGLDNAGKTTILNNLIGDPHGYVSATCGFTEKSIKIGPHFVTLFDVGGGNNIRGYWERYYHEVHGLVFVVDSAAAKRLEEVSAVFRQMLAHPMVQRKPILVFANKQDLPKAMHAAELSTMLGLDGSGGALHSRTHIALCTALPPPVAQPQPGPNQTHVAPAAVPSDPAILNGINWLLDAAAEDWFMLATRVQMDTTQQKELHEQEIQATLARVKARREQEEREEEAKLRAQGIDPRTVAEARAAEAARLEAEHARMIQQQQANNNAKPAAPAPVKQPVQPSTQIPVKPPTTGHLPAVPAQNNNNHAAPVHHTPAPMTHNSSAAAISWLSGAFNSAADMASSAAHAVADTTVAAANVVADTTVSVAHTIGEKFDENRPAMEQTAHQAADYTVETAQTVGTAVADAMPSRETVEHVASDVVDSTVAAANSVGDGISSAASYVGDGVSCAANSVEEVFTDEVEEMRNAARLKKLEATLAVDEAVIFASHPFASRKSPRPAPQPVVSEPEPSTVQQIEAAAEAVVEAAAPVVNSVVNSVESTYESMTTDTNSGSSASTQAVEAVESVAAEIASAVASIEVPSLPDVSLPEVSLPEISMPEVSLPEISMPEVSLPEISLPVVSLPEISMPEVSLPEISMPEVSLPDISMPEVSLPEISMPEVSLPEISMPQVSLPEISMPEVSLPEVSVPEVSLPEIPIPDIPMPSFSGVEAEVVAATESVENVFTSAVEAVQETVSEAVVVAEQSVSYDDPSLQQM